METRFLETFLTIAKAGSIAAAARLLDLAPTTIAQQIKALEKEIGCPLLLRSGHTVKPTSAGQRILARAQLVIRDVNDICAIAKTDDLPPGPLKLGATPSALMGLLPNALKLWNNLYPKIGILIQPGDSIPLFAQVAEGEIDAAIIGDPLFKTPKSCGWHNLQEEELVLVTKRDMIVTDPLAVIKASPFIRFDRSFMIGKLVDQFLRHHEISPQAQFELDGVAVIANFVSAGLGVSILPKCHYILNQAEHIRSWPLPEPCPRRKVAFSWFRASVQAPLAMALLEILML